MAMQQDTISDFLAEQRDEAPEELQPIILEFEDLWERKLWHQLTNSLTTFFNHAESAPLRLQFYKVFVLKFADKINQLKLVNLALKAATQCKDNKERLSFMEGVANKVNNEDSQDAYVFATTAVARVKIDLGDLDGARRDLDRAERILDSFDSVETIVRAAFYGSSADYYQRRADFGLYYRNVLLYLACIDLDSLDAAERRTRAHDLAVAALVSTSIYNFGELLLHPILEALAASPRAEDRWLRDLLFAFNRGDLAAYDALVATPSEQAALAAADPLLAAHAAQLRQKMCLAALTEAVFRRPPHARAMSFAAIARETRVRPDDIEHLVMRALSLGLLRGTIDQVAQVAQINWVQPKVLDMTQIENMRQRLVDWDATVNQLGSWIEKAGQDVWAV